MTARAQTRELEQFIALGAEGVISKPFDPMTLANEVGSHLHTLRDVLTDATLALAPCSRCLFLAALPAFGAPADSQPSPLTGFNVIQSPGHPFGSPSAQLSLANAKRIGANTIAVVPFLWQGTPASPDPVAATT